MRPLAKAETLPSECYNSHQWFDREMARIFMPSWTLVGRGDEIEEPGSYIALDTEWGGPVVVCRGNDGQLHAFANVCCHRGAKVVPDGKGQGSHLGLVCPYHAWTYDFDGTLKWAPGMQHTDEFNENDVRLAPIRCETFHGFVFISVSPDAKPLAECLGDLPQKLPDWFGEEGACREMVVAGRRDYTVECNWKFLMENTCETYHTSVVHRDSLGSMKSSPMTDHAGDWDAVQVPTDRSVVPLPSDFTHTDDGSGSAVQLQPLPAFTNKTAFVNLFPSLQINVTWDCVWWMRILPTGPTTTKVSMGFCFPKATTELVHFSRTLERYMHRWHTAVSEDNAISLNQQRGVRSIFRVPGRMGQLEFGNHNFNNWLLSNMLDGVASWDPGKRIHVYGDWTNADPDMMRLAKESEL